MLEIRADSRRLLPGREILGQALVSGVAQTFLSAGSTVLSSAYVFSAVAAPPNGARRLRRFCVAQTLPRYRLARHQASTGGDAA